MLPVLFQSQTIAIQTLWVFVAIGLMTASYSSIQRLKRRRGNFTLLTLHGNFFVISALLGSRLVYFFTHTLVYVPRFDLRTLQNFVSIWDQGLSFWGALFGLWVAYHIKIKPHDEDGAVWADAISVPVLIAMMIGNVGAFLGGYGYGSPTDLPWGVTYSIDSVKYTVPVHPTQIYATLLIALLLIAHQQLQRKKTVFDEPGKAALFLAWGYSGIHFFLEFLRGDDTLLIFGIRTPMIIALMAFLSLGALLLKRLRTHPTPL